MRTLIAILTLLTSSVLSADEWKWDLKVRENGSAVIYAMPNGKYSLSDAVTAVPKEIWIKHFRLGHLGKNSKIQEELHQYMAKNYPDEHMEALNSAGNMHNPKVRALRKAFQEAILSTSFSKEVNTKLSARCEEITSTSYEKFIISKRDIQPSYEAIVWLSTKKCT